MQRNGAMFLEGSKMESFRWMSVLKLSERRLCGAIQGKSRDGRGDGPLGIIFHKKSPRGLKWMRTF